MTAESYEALPQNVKDIVDSWDEMDKYNECDRIIKELEPLGYTAEYGLCGELHSVMSFEDANHNHSIVLKAIMERYGGLTAMICDWREDYDVVLVNIADDINDELDEDMIEDIINKIIG
jgi:hypothetical protein